jgi:hypothetical protein
MNPAGNFPHIIEGIAVGLPPSTLMAPTTLSDS